MKKSHKLWKQIYDNGMSIFRSVDVLVCRRFGLSTFWFVDVLVCRRFGLSTFRFVDVSVCRRFGCRRFGLSTFWPVTVQVTIIDIVIRPQCTNRPLFLASISVIWAEFTFMSQSMTFIAFNMPSMPAIVHAVIRFATVITAISVSLLSGYATRVIRSFWHRLAGGISLSARSFVISLLPCCSPEFRD